MKKCHLKNGNERKKTKKWELKEIIITQKLTMKERKTSQKQEIKERNPFKNWKQKKVL